MLEQDIETQQDEHIDPDTAITAFVGWLTSRHEVSGPFSFSHDACDAVNLLKMFCEAQGWNSPLDRFLRQIEVLKQHYPKSQTCTEQDISLQEDTWTTKHLL